MTTAASAAASTGQSPVPFRRRGRVATLPKMNNSERGKYYRRKYKEHELQLEQSIVDLRKQVRDLELFLDVRDTLAHYNPADSSDSIVAHIFDYFVRSREGVRFDSSFYTSPGASSSSFPTTADHHARVYKWDTSHIFLYFNLQSFHVEGNHETPVVVMRGIITALYARTTIESLFPHLLHDENLLRALLNREVRYPCTYRFYFARDGTLHHKHVEADYVHGLQQVLGELEDVRSLLDGSHRLRRRQDSLVDMLRGPSSMDLDFILT